MHLLAYKYLKHYALKFRKSRLAPIKNKQVEFNKSGLLFSCHLCYLDMNVGPINQNRHKRVNNFNNNFIKWLNFSKPHIFLL